MKAEAEALGTAHRALAEKLRHFGDTLFDAVNKDDKYLKATANVRGGRPRSQSLRASTAGAARRVRSQLRKHDDLLKELDAQGIANYQPPAAPAEKDKKVRVVLAPIPCLTLQRIRCRCSRVPSPQCVFLTHHLCLVFVCVRSLQGAKGKAAAAGAGTGWCPEGSCRMAEGAACGIMSRCVAGTAG